MNKAITKVLTKKNLAKINFIFIFVFLNAWDIILNGTFLNAMTYGIILFGLVGLLWLGRNIKIISLLTLISIMEFVALSILIVQGFQLSGTDAAEKTIFWIPYLLMAALNLYWGLRTYSKSKHKLISPST